MERLNYTKFKDPTESSPLTSRYPETATRLQAHIDEFDCRMKEDPD